MPEITLKSAEGDSYQIDGVAAAESQTIKHLIEDDCATGDIPLPNLKSKILGLVIDYCNNIIKARNFMKKVNDDTVKVDRETLLHLILAADYLNINSLLDLTCQTVADEMKGKTPEEIHKIFDSILGPDNGYRCMQILQVKGLIPSSF